MPDPHAMMRRARNARLRLTLALLVSRASSKLSSADSFNSATGRPGFPMASLDHTRNVFSRNFVSGGLAAPIAIQASASEAEVHAHEREDDDGEGRHGDGRRALA